MTYRENLTFAEQIPAQNNLSVFNIRRSSGRQCMQRPAFTRLVDILAASAFLSGSVVITGKQAYAKNIAQFLAGERQERLESDCQVCTNLE